MVTIPRRWMISIRTCASSDSLITCLAANGIHVPVYGHEAQLALALALYSEMYVLAHDSRVFLRYRLQAAWPTVRVGRLSAISAPKDGPDRALLGVQILGRRRS